MVIDVRWGSASHQGRVRDHNEDAVLAGPDVFAVADGMGGPAGGEVASALAIAGLADVRNLHGSADPAAHLVAALEHINDEIRRRAGQEGAVAGMGTTVAGVARIAGPRLLVFHVGDSRVYRLRAGQLHQLTDDHSVVGELIRAGELTADEARAHPHRNVVTRALGAAAGVTPAVTTVDVRVGDCFLVASDGLFNEVPDTEISFLLATPGGIERRARALLDAALFRGGRDNVSVVIVAVTGTSAGDGLEADTSPSVPAARDLRAPIGRGASMITAVPASTLGPMVPGDPRSPAPDHR